MGRRTNLDWDKNGDEYEAKIKKQDLEDIAGDGIKLESKMIHVIDNRQLPRSEPLGGVWLGAGFMVFL